MKLSKFLTILLTFSLAGAGYAAAQLLQKGQIEAFRVEGDVNMINSISGESSQLTPGTVFGPGLSIQTGPSSTVLLFFSNGSAINLQPDSHLDINQFVQAEFEYEGPYTSLQEEPSQSITEMYLHYGELIGEVRKLRADSSYTINTSAGKAEILGTTFVVRYRPGQDGGRTEIFNLNGTVIATVDNNVFNLEPGKILIANGKLEGDRLEIDDYITKDATREEIAQVNKPIEDIDAARGGSGVPAGRSGVNNQGPGTLQTPPTEARVVTVSPI